MTPAARERTQRKRTSFLYDSFEKKTQLPLSFLSSSFLYHSLGMALVPSSSLESIVRYRDTSLDVTPLQLGNGMGWQNKEILTE
jgi:hypothetical protein